MEVGRRSSDSSEKDGGYKEVTNECKDVSLDLNVDDQGWAAVDDLKVSKFQGRRARVPKPLLDGGNVKFHEINFRKSRIVSKVTLAQPGFDWGLGCFGNPTKLIETGKGELDRLHWVDFHEVRISKELAEGHEVWERGYDDWLIFQRSTQKNTEVKTEQELIDFHENQQAFQTDSDQEPSRRNSEDTVRFLTQLGNLEAAHPKVQAEEVTIQDPAERKGTWAFLGAEDWIEEADFEETNLGT
ncbi:hypothetical protein F5Y04DRAFT_275910 [Hypomontagnella monticulosa]|nr:hypothetical protein F5Y04DRAFT_275910 [Hypomontagnella monticulosa]